MSDGLPGIDLSNEARDALTREWSLIEPSEFWRVYTQAMRNFRDTWSRSCELPSTELDKIRYWQGMVAAYDILCQIPKRILARKDENK